MSLIIKMDSIKSVEHLKTSIPYIMNEEKTKGLTFSNAGVTEGQIINSFMLTKELNPAFGKREAYHFKFSFSKDERISSEDALEFIKEWAEAYLGDEHDYVVSVHQDREHLHMHIVFNSVRRSGGKYRYEKGDWEKIIKPLTNQLAEKYHTGQLKERDAGKDYSPDYGKKKDGVTWKERVQADMDSCIAGSKSYSDFKRKMVSEFHYQLREGVSREHGVYLALTPPGKAKAIRSYRLDAGYMPADIEEKIEGRYVMPDADGIDHANGVLQKSSMEAEKKSTIGGENHKLDWMMSRNYTFIPYQNLSDYQKAIIRQALEAKHFYRRTGTSMQIHEQSVRAVKSMLQRTEGLGMYRKINGKQAEQVRRYQQGQQEQNKKIQKSMRKWR